MQIVEHKSPKKRSRSPSKGGPTPWEVDIKEKKRAQACSVSVTPNADAHPNLLPSGKRSKSR